MYRHPRDPVLRPVGEGDRVRPEDEQEDGDPLRDQPEQRGPLSGAEEVGQDRGAGDGEEGCGERTTGSAGGGSAGRRVSRGDYPARRFWRVGAHNSRKEPWQARQISAASGTGVIPSYRSYESSNVSGLSALQFSTTLRHPPVFDTCEAAQPPRRRGTSLQHPCQSRVAPALESRLSGPASPGQKQPIPNAIPEIRSRGRGGGAGFGRPPSRRPGGSYCGIIAAFGISDMKWRWALLRHSEFRI